MSSSSTAAERRRFRVEESGLGIGVERREELVLGLGVESEEGVEIWRGECPGDNNMIEFNYDGRNSKQRR